MSVNVRGSNLQPVSGLCHNTSNLRHPYNVFYPAKTWTAEQSMTMSKPQLIILFTATNRHRDTYSRQKPALPHLRWPHRMHARATIAQPRTTRAPRTTLPTSQATILSAPLSRAGTIGPPDVRGPYGPAATRGSILDLGQHSLGHARHGVRYRVDVHPGRLPGDRAYAGAGCSTGRVPARRTEFLSVAERVGDALDGARERSR